MGTVFKTVRAEQDLDDIWFYSGTDNVGAADRMLDDIGDTAAQLARQPLMGRVRPELAPDLRSFPVGRYILFYRPVSAGIEIIRALHSARDVPGVAEQGGFTAN